MNSEFLSPISERLLEQNETISKQALGSKIKIHSEADGFPDLSGVKIAIFGVLENRNQVNHIGEQIELDAVRNALYSLFPGNWNTSLADLGDIKAGNTVEDTYFALKEIISSLLNLKIIPVVIGGSQDLTYPIYRAYDGVLPMVNLVNVDQKFNLGDSTKPINSDSFVGKIILDEPYNLFNFATLGYQTYFNAQEEIDLMDSLYFEAYRLGEISNNIALAEPVMRDANIVSLNINTIKASELSLHQNNSPNGFTGKEICAIARYAGISNKVSAFGVFDYKMVIDNALSAMMIAQIIWYFIEGVNCRVFDDNFEDEKDMQKFITLTETSELIFYKSLKTQRWWIEIPFLTHVNNKLKKHTLLPCMHQDYLDACNNKVPERWYKACRKNNI